MITTEEKQKHDEEYRFAAWQDWAVKIVGKCPICDKLPEFVIASGKYLKVGHGQYPENCCIWGLSDKLVECNIYWNPEDYL